MKKTTGLLWLCLVLSAIQGLGQSSPTDNISLLLQQAQAALDASDYEGALGHCQAAQLQLPEVGEDSLRMEVMGMMGEVYYELEDFFSATEYFEKVVSVANEMEYMTPKDLVDLLNQLGISYTRFDDTKNALSCFKKAVSISKQNDLLTSELKVRLYTNMGVCYNKLLDFDNALLYFTKVLEIDKRTSSDDYDIAIDYNNLGICFEKMGEYNRAIDYHKKSLNIREKRFGLENPRIAISLNNLGICYKLKGDYAKALEYFNRCLHIREKTLGANHYNTVYALYNIGNTYLVAKQYDSALAIYFLALKRSEKSLRADSPKVLNIYEKIAEVYMAINEYDEAEKYCEKIISKLSGVNEGPLDFNQVRYPLNLLDAYSLMQKILFRKYKISDEISDLTLVLDIQEKLLKTMEFLKISFEEGSSEEYLIENYLADYEIAIEAYYLLTQELNEYKYFEEALKVCEKSKNFLLIEALQISDAKKFARVPDSLIRLEKKLAIEISDLEWEKFDFLQTTESPSEEAVLALDGKIFDKKKTYHALLSNYKNNYPAYYKMKYELPEITLKTIQDSLLSDRQTLVEYFIGENHHFVFAITKDTFLMMQLNDEIDLKKAARNYHRLIASFPQQLLQGNPPLDSLTRLGHQLYQNLLGPLAGLCREELIIIPDGELEYLPFEALIRQEVRGGADFASIDWVLKDHAISYCNSVALLMELEEDDFVQRNSAQLLAVAPTFGETDLPLALRSADLGELKYNQQEIDQINQLISGVQLNGSLATVDTFKILAPNYRILHLATHAVANDKTGDYSFLAFTSPVDSNHSGELYATEIYNLQLDAEMVVLSACETGIGELKRGEGMISLARAFTYAGARSLINSIWQVNDKQTAKLMTHFYAELVKGKSKAVALQQAKLKLLDSEVGQAAHPFYWAAFKAYGNRSAIELSQPSFFKWWMIFVLGLGGVLFGVYQKRKNSALSKAPS